MYLVLSQVEHQTIECHRKNINIVYLFGLSVVSLSYYYKPGRPPLADLPSPPLTSHTSPAALPWQTSPGTPWQTSPDRSPLQTSPWHRPPLTLPWQTSPAWQTSPQPHTPPWLGSKKLKMMSVSSFFHFFINFLSFFIIF